MASTTSMLTSVSNVTDCSSAYTLYVNTSMPFVPDCSSVGSESYVTLDECLASGCQGRVNVIAFLSSVCMLYLCHGDNIRLKTAVRGWAVYKRATMVTPREAEGDAPPLWSVLVGVGLGVVAMATALSVAIVVVTKRKQKAKRKKMREEMKKRKEEKREEAKLRKSKEKSVENDAHAPRLKTGLDTVHTRSDTDSGVTSVAEIYSEIDEVRTQNSGGHSNPGVKYKNAVNLFDEDFYLTTAT